MRGGFRGPTFLRWVGRTRGNRFEHSWPGGSRAKRAGVLARVFFYWWKSIHKARYFQLLADRFGRVITYLNAESCFERPCPSGTIGSFENFFQLRGHIPPKCKFHALVFPCALYLVTVTLCAERCGGNWRNELSRCLDRSEHALVLRSCSCHRCRSIARSLGRVERMPCPRQRRGPPGIFPDVAHHSGLFLWLAA